MLLDRFHQDLEFRNEATLSFEVLFSERDKTASKLNSLECDIDSLKSEQEKTHNSMTTDPNLDADYRVSRSLERARIQIDRCRRCTFLEWKLSESLVELRQMKNTVYESEVKCEKSQQSVCDIQKLCANTQQQLADLKMHLVTEKRMRAITNCDGHLIWRIDQFAAKFKDAKENDTTLRSPMFCNIQYGYTLRVSQMFHTLIETNLNCFFFRHHSIVARHRIEWIRQMERSKYAFMFDCCERRMGRIAPLAMQTQSRHHSSESIA